jgi:NAD+ dependent glucose-6-phosphate dehydrogenase
MPLPKLLITGYAGLVGQVLWRGLADSFELYGMDIHKRESADNVFQADISNPTEINAVFEQIPQLSHVVHLAGDPRADADWESVLKNNIAGTRNLYEAARIHGVKRVVFASSNHVTGAYEGFPPSLHTQSNPRLITPEDPIRPDGNYGVSKAAGEVLARMYYEFYGIESVCLRIGTVLNDDDPTRDPRHASTWLSHRDLVQLVKKSLLAKVPFAIYYGVSNNTKRFWDISNAQAEIGYRPESDASVHG